MHNQKTDSMEQLQKHYEGPTADNDNIYARATLEQKADWDTFVQRANRNYARVMKQGVPAWFKPTFENYQRQNAEINIEDLYALKTAVGETVWDKDYSALIGVPSTTMEKVRWDIKDYILTSVEQPRFSRKFRMPRFMKLAESSQHNEGVGMYLGLSMSFTEIAESGGALWSPLAFLTNQLAAVFGLHKSRRFFLGTSILGGHGDDEESGSLLGITGLCNASGIQTFEAGGDEDDNIVADYDIEESCRVAMADLDKVYVPHRKVLLTSRGILAETLLPGHRDATTGVSDFARVVQKWFATGYISDWIVCDQLRVPATGTVPSKTAEQDIFLICVGEQTVAEEKVYPLQTIPLQNKMYANDLAEVMLFGNIVYYRKADTTNNAFPATWAAALTTTTNGQEYPQGRVDVRGIMASLKGHV